MTHLKSSILALFGTLALASGSVGCKNLKAAGNAALECAKADLGKTVPEAGASILAVVATILKEHGADAKAGLDALADHYKPDLIACAAHVAQALFAPPADGSKTASSGAPDPAAVAAAQAWIDGRGYTFVK